jgi:tetratricopeptide (TPR) repeat protein
VEQLNLEYAKAELRGDIAGLFRAQQQLVARDSGALALSLSGEAAVWMLRPSVAIPAFEHAHATFRVMGGWADAAHSSLMAQAYHLAGRHQLERNTLTEVRFDISDHGFIRGRLLLAYAGLGKPTEALAVADTLLRDDDQTRPTAIASVLTGAEEFRAHGDSITAAQILARARAWIAMHPRATPSSNRQLVEGMVFLESGAPDSAIARLTLAARDTSRIEAAGYLALARYARGDRAGAQSIADSLGALKRPWMFGRNTFWRAAILGALGERERAVQLLQQAHTEGQPMEMWHSLAALQPLHGYPPFDALIRPEI